MRKWLVVLALMLIALVALALSRVATSVPLLTTPSPRNPGPGGLTRFVSILEGMGYVVLEPTSLRDCLESLASYDPRATAIIATGFSRGDYAYSEELARWVESGGLLVVMDEFEDAAPVLKRFGIEIGTPVVGISVANCSKRYRVTLDVYSFVSGGEPLCTVASHSVAVEKSFGRGELVAIGDSSLAINYLASYPRIFEANVAFLTSVLKGRRIVAIYFPRSLESAPIALSRVGEAIGGIVLFSARLLTSTPLALSLTTFFVVSIVALFASTGIRMRRGREGDFERKLYEARRELNSLLESLYIEGRKGGEG